MSEITTANTNDVNNVHGQLQILQQIISAVETEIYSGESCRPPSSIMGGHNEQANLRSINKYGNRSIHKVKVQISSQSSIKCMILEPHPSDPDTNKMDSNYDTCCLGTDFIVIAMTERTADFTHTIIHMNLCIMYQ